MQQGLDLGWNKGVHVVTRGSYTAQRNDVSNLTPFHYVNYIKKHVFIVKYRVLYLSRKRQASF
jgi:hypothetical protein